MLLKDLQISSRSFSFDYVLFLFYLCIPLIYWPNNSHRSYIIRSLTFIGLSVLLAYVKSEHFITIIKKGFRTYRNTLLILCILMVLVLFSTIKSDLSVLTSFIGTEPIYLGLLFWISVLIFSIYYRKLFLQYISSDASTIVFLVILSFSIFIDRSYIIHSSRISGVVMQATTLSMMAVIYFSIALYRMSLTTSKSASRYLTIVLLILSVATVVLTYSRIGSIGLIVAGCLFGVNSLTKASKSYWMIVVIMLGVISLLIFTKLCSVNRFSTNMLNEGVSYRSSLYVVSSEDLFNNYPLIGKGPGQLPSAINDKNMVPDDIADTLSQSIIFSSTHNLFLDVGYYFGLVVSLILLVFSLYCLVSGISSKRYEVYVLTIIFLTLFLNAIFNVPSIELTSLYFISLVSLYYCLPKHFKLKKWLTAS